MKRRFTVVLSVVLVLTLFAGAGAALFFRNSVKSEDAPVYEFPAPDSADIAPPSETLSLPEVQPYVPAPEEFARDADTSIEFVRGIVVVYFDRAATEEQKNAAVQSVDGTIAGRADMMGKWTLSVKGDTLAALQAHCDTLLRQPGVLRAIPDQAADISFEAVTLNDPFKGKTTINNITYTYNDAAANRAWIDADRLPEAWDYNSQMAQAQIGMIDSGARLTHEELANRNITKITSLSGRSFPDNPADHGTAVAGILNAAQNNRKGGAGAVFNAKLFEFDVPDSSLTWNVIRDCIAELLRQNVRAVNMSFGYDNTDLTDAELTSLAQDAAFDIAQWISYGYTKAVFVQAAGNAAKDAFKNGFLCSITPENTGLEGHPYVTPAMVLNRVLVVASYNPHAGGSALSGSSRYGAQISLAAPAESIFVPFLNGYCVVSGTSFAAPQVTAVAAMMAALNSDLDGGQIGALLKSPAVSPKTINRFSSQGPDMQYGRLDARAALDAALSQPILTGGGSKAQVYGTCVVAAAKTPASTVVSQLTARGGTIQYSGADLTKFVGTGETISVVSPLGDKTADYTIVVKGDLSGDGRVNARDAQLLRRAIAGSWQPNYPPNDMDILLFAADMNDDGVLTNADADLIFAAGMQ